MTLEYRLKPEQLTSIYNVNDLKFETTKELKPLKTIIGQKRGIDALKFGLEMKMKGYNIYVTGISGTGRSSFTNSITEEFAKAEPVPCDWIYVYNFHRKDSPRAIALESGKGKAFKIEIESMSERFQKYIPEIFTGMEYESKVKNISKITNQKKTVILKNLNKKSAKYGFIYSPTEEGFVFIPLKNGRAMNEEEYQSLSIDTREDLAMKYDDLHLSTYEDLNLLTDIDMEMEQDIKLLDQNVVSNLVNIEIRNIIDR